MLWASTCFCLLSTVWWFIWLNSCGSSCVGHYVAPDMRAWCRDPGANGYSAGRKIIHNHWITTTLIHEYWLGYDGNLMGELWLHVLFCTMMLMGRTKSFYASQSIVITREIWRFNGGEESPSETLHCTSVDVFDWMLCFIRNISFSSFLSQWCFMAHHRWRSNANWVPPKSSPPVARIEVPCRMERSAFTATGTFLDIHLNVIDIILSAWWIIVFVFLNPVPMKGSLQLGSSHWLLPQRPFHHVSPPTLWEHVPCMNRLLLPYPTQH